MSNSDTNNRILLMSSGMDSLIAWFYLSKPDTLHINGHSRYSKYELDAIHDLSNSIEGLNPVIVEGFDWLSKFEQNDGNIPLRNMHFICVAAHYGDHIYIPCQLGEQSIPDRSAKFFLQSQKTLSYLKGEPVIVDPVFQDMTKQDMVKWYKDMKLPTEYLYMTYSCMSGYRGRCGECGACFRTAIALDYNNILPDTFFQKDIWMWDNITHYIDRMKSDEYERRRTAQTLEVLEKRGFKI